MKYAACLASLAFLCVPAVAHADAALLLASPYGRSGSFNPTGHVGVYLSRVCAATPTRLRRCADGETGVVISRYNRVGDWDWVAIPLIPYLYAVERAADVPEHVDPGTVSAMREQYRQRHLRAVEPDGPDGAPSGTNWIQLVGAVYDRQIVAFSVTTTASQDDELIAALNGQENRRRFNLLFRNCADFARDVMNRFYPGAIRSNVIADFGFTTPKQIVRSLTRYGARRPELALSAYLIPQIPGNRQNSKPARGVLESLLKTKKYSIPLTVVQPWVPVGLAVGYLTTGRFNPQHYVTRSYEPGDVERHALRATEADASSLTRP